jgi:hypothetical protein
VMEINGLGARYGISDDAVEKRMRAFGFVQIQYNPVERLVVETRGAARDSGNCIFVRDVNAVTKRVGSGKSFRVLGQEI